MPLQKLQFRPGINKEGTNYSNEGGWFDCDKVRFKQGYAEKIGGWEKTTTIQIDGRTSKLYNFLNLNSLNYLFIGTSQKVLLEESATFEDITPLRRAVLLPFSVTGVEATADIGSDVTVVV